MCNQGLIDFTKNTLNDYYRSLRVLKYCKNISVSEKSDFSNFDQIGVKYKLEDAIFDPNSDVFPGVIGLTDVITLGEQAYFVKKFINDDKIPKYEIKRKKFTPKYFEGQIGDWDAIAIFPVDIFFDELHKNKAWFKYINYPDKDARFYQIYPCFPVSQKLIKEIDHKIIIFHNVYTSWKYVEYFNKYTEKSERLKIEIDDSKNGFRNVLLKTVNKLNYKKEYVKIIEIIE